MPRSATAAASSHARGIANWLDVAAQVGILAAAVTLLMIAGEFDLSVGSMIGAAGMVIAIGMSEFGCRRSSRSPSAFAFALAVGFFNGWLVTKTGLPSFIVTLGMLFLLRGLTIGLTRHITSRTQVGQLDQYTEGDLFSSLFTGEVDHPCPRYRDRGIGGVVGPAHGRRRVDPVPDHLRQLDPRHRRQQGLGPQRGRPGAPREDLAVHGHGRQRRPCWRPSRCWSSARPTPLAADSKELEAIAAAVIGGNLLTGGYGSPIGTFFGALTLGMTQVGIPMAGLPGDWFRAVLGVVLLVAVLGSNWIRMRGTGVRS